MTDSCTLDLRLSGHRQRVVQRDCWTQVQWSGVFVGKDQYPVVLCQRGCVADVIDLFLLRLLRDSSVNANGRCTMAPHRARPKRCDPALNH
eukprot:3591957-Prorocentrum_lima.AAC.1